MLKNEPNLKRSVANSTHQCFCRLEHKKNTKKIIFIILVDSNLSLHTMNLLKNETSPYLLQHAENPVHWMPWSEDAFQKAKQENKPVLLSIGYSSCHWCHVMAHESFEDLETAELMNKHFINIKLDREEYPDIDHYYMDALQAMTGAGGWPLNIFLTPDKKPFYGGTYFPPKKYYNRASWKETLINVFHFFQENRKEVERQSDQLTNHLRNGNLLVKNTQNITNSYELEDKKLHQLIAEKILKTADLEEGGFGTAPKFPATFAIKYLLDYYQIYQDEKALKHACLSLNKMMMGGIYDHVGGGFARYSTDRNWIAPHFEKMLYDNALLIEVYSIAFSITKNESYKRIVEEIVAWLNREMLNEEGGFYSAIDADSEGQEGKFYTWSYDELKDVLKNNFEAAKNYYQISKEGNWEGSNILYTTQNEVQPREFEKIKQLNEQLLKKRNERIKPFKDQKIILEWNALLCKSLALASLLLDNGHYVHIAEKNIKFILDKMNSKEFDFYHTRINGINKIPAYIDDLAYLCDACIQLNIATANPEYLYQAEKIMNSIFENFSSDIEEFFYFTHKKYQQTAGNKIDIYDGAIPSPNAVLCKVLMTLSILTQNHYWQIKTNKMLEIMQPYIENYPSSFSVWASNILYKNENHIELTVAGNDAKKQIEKLYQHQYTPNLILIASDRENNHYKYIDEKFKSNETQYFICRHNSCLPPFTSIEKIITLFF